MGQGRGAPCGQLVCVHCGCPVPDLYQTVGAEIRLRQCPRCCRAVDRYIEFDTLLVLVDLQLLRQEVYRHILHNRCAAEPGLLWHEACRFLLVCLMLDAHARLALSWDDGGPQAGSSAAWALPGWPERWDSDLPLLLLVFLEMAAFLAAVTLTACRWPCGRAGCEAEPRPRSIWRGVLVATSVSSFGKLLGLLTVIWGGRHRALMHVSVSVFVLASNVVGVKTALEDSHWTRAVFAVGAGVAARMLVSLTVPSMLGVG